MDGLYYQPCPDCGGLENAKKPQTTFSAEALTKGLREIYDGMNVRDEIERYIFEETLRQFNKATAKGIVESGHAADLSDEFIRQLRTNNTVFSAFRTHRMQNDIAKQLLDSDGHLKSFDRWMRDIKGMTNHYTGNWLQSEYSTAVIRAQQAADWKHFEEEQDVFPNLRWMPTTSPNQDPLHRQYWESKLTLPVNHPFWDEHRPGDRWNCKCRLEPTDEPANDRVIKGFNPVPTQPGLDNNPGKDGQIFSDSHPYFTNAYPGAEKAVRKIIKEDSSEMMPNKGEAVAPPHVKTYNRDKLNHDIYISPYHGKEETDENLRIARVIQPEIKDKIYLLPRLDSNTIEQQKLRDKMMPKNVTGIKNPDYMINGETYDAKSLLGSKATESKQIRRRIQNHIRNASKQAENIILELPEKFEHEDIYNAIIGYLKQSNDTHKVIVIWRNNIITFDLN